jgi:hypothetical protein
VLRASLFSLVATASIVTVIGCSSAEPDVAGTASNDYTETTPSDPAQRPATTFGADASVSTDPTSDASPKGADAAPEASIPSIPWSCTGSYGTTKASNGDYYITAFGCWKDAAGVAHGDTGDNCIPSCFAQAKAAGVCLPGETGKQCEERVTWFTADAARFGCLAKLKVTNPANGKSVIAIALDFGPSCTAVEDKVMKGVLDASGRVDRQLFGSDQGFQDRSLVHVTEVPDSTPLGPVP